VKIRPAENCKNLTGHSSSGGGRGFWRIPAAICLFSCFQRSQKTAPKDRVPNRVRCGNAGFFIGLRILVVGHATGTFSHFPDGVFLNFFSRVHHCAPEGFRRTNFAIGKGLGLFRLVVAGRDHLPAILRAPVAQFVLVHARIPPFFSLCLSRKINGHTKLPARSWAPEVSQIIPLLFCMIGQLCRLDGLDVDLQSSNTIKQFQTGGSDADSESIGFFVVVILWQVKQLGGGLGPAVVPNWTFLFQTADGSTVRP